MSGLIDTLTSPRHSKRLETAAAEGTQRLRLALELTRMGTWVLDVEASLLWLDARMLEMWGEPAGTDVFDLPAAIQRIHPEDRPAVQDALEAALDPAGEGVYRATYRVIHDSGRTRWVHTIGQATFAGENGDRHAVQLEGTARDCTEEKCGEALLLAQTGLLERIARGESVADILDAIVRVVVELAGDCAAASVMLLDAGGGCLRHGAAAGLPEHYLEAVDGIAIGREIGTCAAAAARNEVVITENFRTDPAWDGIRHLPLGEGLHGAWSMPIRDSEGKVRGTLGTYFREPRGPEPREVRVVGLLAETAGLAIEKLASRERLEEATAHAARRERLYEAAVSTTPDLVYVFGLDHRFTYANAALLEMWGKSWDEAIGKNCLELGYPDWHADMHSREIDQVISTRRPIKGEVPFTGTKGRRIYEYIFTPVINENGQVEAVAGTTRDVTERKAAEDRAQFLSSLTRKLAALSSEEEIVATAVEAAGRFLNAHRCYFVEIRPDSQPAQIGSDWLRDADSARLSGRLPPAGFDGGGDRWLHDAPENFTVRDVATDPLTRGSAAGYAAFEIASFALQTFRNETTVILGATERVPREWAADELTLLESVLARTWPLVERVRSEAAARRNENHLKVVMNNVPFLLSYVDGDHHYRFANDQYTEWFGRSPEEMRGIHARDLLGEEGYQARLPYVRRVMAGETVKMDSHVIHPRLGPRELEVALIPDAAPGGNIRGFFVMGIDLTDHKLAQASLLRRNERLRLLWETARILLTTDDPETMLQRLFGEISGHLGADCYFNYAVAEGGKSLHLRSCHGITEEDAASCARIGFGEGLCGRIASGGKPVIVATTDESDFRPPFGIRAYAGFPLASDGQVLGTLALASRSRDSFTPDELEFIETVSHYVTAAYVRLELLSNLREGDRRKDEFLATLAHELRNPLAPIRTGIEVLKQTTGQPEKAAPIIGIIERQTAQMVRLIDDLIDVSRITRGKMELRREIIDLAEVLPGAIEAVQPMIDRSGHHFVSRLPAGPVLVDGDAGRLSQVFANLLNNAARYTPPGGEISLVVEIAADTVTVAVRDNGEGIDPAMQDRIFEMFTQVKRKDASASEGLGIGLTLVRLLVAMHGGTIAVTSEGTGKGSEFTVALPRVAARTATPEDAAGPAARPATNRTCKVLVVDDGASAADMLTLFFKLEGYDACTAYDGFQALELAAKTGPRVVFIDIGMPGMDGNETARRLRQIPGCEDAILVALTGWGQDSDRKKTKEAGFDHHLVKPAEPNMLRNLLAQLDL